MKNSWLPRAVKILIIATFFAVLIGTIVMLLWNWLMPTIFNLPFINLGQAIGLVVLSKLLTGGIRVSPTDKEYWLKKKQLYDKWANMTPTEREQWKTEWRNRCEQSRKMGFKQYEDGESDQI